MKKNTLLFILLFQLFSNVALCQTRFSPDPANIVWVEYVGDGVNLKLTIEGIRLGKTSSGSKKIANIVVQTHKTNYGGTSDLKVSRVKAQVYAHCKLYNFKQSPKSKINNHANPINMKYIELIL